VSRAVLETLETRRLLAVSSIVYAGADGRLVYAPDAQGDVIPDFSMVGYKTGNVSLPNTAGGVSVPVKQTINPGAPGVDMTATIQGAINAVSALAPDGNGFRGAVLLTAGNYPVSGTLNINASGVVLMGVGDSSTTGTRLEATGTATRFLIDVSGSGSRSTSGTTYNFTDSYVPVGASSFHVDTTASLNVGDSILVTRPSPANWIHDIGMDLLDNPWTAGSKNQNWERVVTGISGNTVTVDVPLTNSLDVQYGGGTFKHYSFSGRINQVGISDLYMYSDSTGAGDLAHATGSVTMDLITNGWMHNITSDGFAVNQVVLSSNAKYCTIDDALIQNTTVSSQAPPAGVSVNGQLNLVENVIEHGVYHAVALGSQVPGPNVITNLTADGIGSDCGPHQRWSTGGLFDRVTINDGNDLQAFNRGNSGSGHGWAGANYVFWNCSARNLEIANPPTAQNWAIGCSGVQAGDGVFESLGTQVLPQSLYAKQLWDRLHSNPTVVNTASATPNPRSGTTTNLSVLGGYSLGEANLTYTWSIASKPNGAADPTFSANGTNAAKNSTATFSLAGTYILQCTIADAGGLLATSSVIVTDRPTTSFNGTAGNDTLRIVRNGATSDIYLNNVLQSQQNYATAQLLALNAGDGNDTIIIDYTGGNPVPANGLVVDGGGGTGDVVSVIGSSGADAVSLAVGSITVNGGQAQYADADELDLALGVGSDTLTCTAAAVNAPAMRLDVSGGGSVTMSPGSTLPNFTDLSVGSGASFFLNGQSQTIDALSGSGTVSNANGIAATLTVGQLNSIATFAGVLSDGVGASGSSALSLTKVGFGKLVLSGANSYSGLTTISGGVLESGNSASLVALPGTIMFNGGTIHITANSAANNVANKFNTNTNFAGVGGTIDIDAGVTLTLGTVGGSANLRTNGGGFHGGTFTKTGLGTLRILSNNGQLDDPFKLNAGTVQLESATGLGGADNSSNHLDMKTGTTLILRQDISTNFLTPITVEPNATINVVIDRLTLGVEVNHSLNAFTSSGAFTLNLSAGSNINAGTGDLTLGALTLGGNGTFNVVSGAFLTITGAAGGAFALTKTGAGVMSLQGTNSFTGATTVSAGTLVIQGNLTNSSSINITSGALVVPAFGGYVIKTPAVSITGAGQLLLQDATLIVTTPGQTGSLVGSTYTGITGLVQKGRNGGGWGGDGIVTGMADALGANALTNLAVAKVGQVRGIADSATTMFAGQVVSGSDTVVFYTYSGDATLDGKINIDDYVRIDAGIAAGSSGWTNGDFSYDGKVNIDDYVIIDGNISQQGSPFPTASSASMVSQLAVVTRATPKRTTRAIR
jgi:autotransporter-associated beta strand protein